MNLCLVTGGAGFIGSHIARRLLKLGRRVRILDNFATGRRENIADIERQIDLVVGDMTDPATCDRCVAGVDVVFHLAAIASVPRSVEKPRDSHHANVNGTFNILLAAKNAGVQRVVYSASSSAYGDTPTLPKHESMRPLPISPYAVSKLAGELYASSFAQVYGLATLSLRYFNVFGPRQDPKSQYAAVIPAFVTRMLRGERPIVFGDGEQSRDFCYIDNVVDANLLAGGVLEGPGGPAKIAGEVVNIACGQRTSLNQMIAMINAELGTNIEPEYREKRRGDVRDSLADISEAKRVIGYDPKIQFTEGLKRTIAWYREHTH